MERFSVKEGGAFGRVDEPEWEKFQFLREGGHAEGTEEDKLNAFGNSPPRHPSLFLEKEGSRDGVGEPIGSAIRSC